MNIFREHIGKGQIRVTLSKIQPLIVDHSLFTVTITIRLPVHRLRVFHQLHEPVQSVSHGWHGRFRWVGNYTFHLLNRHTHRIENDYIQTATVQRAPALVGQIFRCWKVSLFDGLIRHHLFVPWIQLEFLHQPHIS